MYYKSLFPDLPKVPESNVHHLLFNRPDQRERPDYTLFMNVATGQRRSFREFVKRVRDGATSLGADVAQGGLGLRPENGELVGILSENCPDYVALMHSLLVITVPFALFSSHTTPYEFKHANSLAHATRIFTSPSLLPLALTSEKRQHKLVSSARKNNIPRLPVRHATKDTLTYPIYSSGTSGPPKVYACYSTKYPRYRYHVTTILLVPSLIHQLVHHPRFKTTDMSSVKSLASGAAYLPSQLADQLCTRFQDKDRVAEGASACYGMSEFTMTIAKNKPGSVGILVPGVEARIVRPDGSLAGPNEPGELLVRGGTAALGYRGNEKATRETFVDGVVLTPSSQDTLKISGMQVSPVEIENTIPAQPDKLITDVSVAGISGGALGKKEVVARLDTWVQGQLSRYKWLRAGIKIVETIPKLPTGKVLRRVLVEEYEREVKAKL
ncbi:uncharacterized protein EDB91DRAFT_1236930 [Suillus paluster]|uniref:uncharacterized protein n=1 Tax=Suillus paluster TaxID=48578 RepID=UPI001B880537|nr:uncharacterized protein EDB91DRAFT_1236930 [Suillus paluster]KAG1742243.1 hypothetical protein EDB91DRAFT_1236930 [Suillus paluster]